VKAGTKAVSNGLNRGMKVDLQFFGKFDKNQDALIQLAKGVQRSGISSRDAKTLLDWAKEYGVTARGPEMHTNRTFGQFIHIHIGPVDHIFIK
jgi:hypothetical protein